MLFLARGGRCQNSCVRMSKVKFDFGTVRTRVIPILKRVEVEDYPAKIGRVYGWSRQHVCYYLGKLEQCGLVKREVRSRAVFYGLTSRGKNFSHHVRTSSSVAVCTGLTGAKCDLGLWRRVVCLLILGVLRW